MMNFSIRDVVPGDAEAIIRILNPIIEAWIHTALDTPFSPEEERDYILNFPRRGVWHVAVQHPDEQLLGFQVLEPFATYTNAFNHVGTLGTYVDLAERRRGIAKALFVATFEKARLKGYEKIFTFVRADNPAALATYLAVGFRVIGTASNQATIDGRYIDEVLIERALSGTLHGAG